MYTWHIKCEHIIYVPANLYIPNNNPGNIYIYPLPLKEKEKYVF